MAVATKALHDVQHLGAVAVPERLVDPVQKTDGFGKRGFLFVRGREVVPDMRVVTPSAFVKVTAKTEV